MYVHSKLSVTLSHTCTHIQIYDKRHSHMQHTISHMLHIISHMLLTISHMLTGKSLQAALFKVFVPKYYLLRSSNCGPRILPFDGVVEKAWGWGVMVRKAVQEEETMRDTVTVNALHKSALCNFNQGQTTNNIVHQVVLLPDSACL